MAVLFTDDFNRANGAIGANYTQLGPDTISIVSNAVPLNFGSNNVAPVTAITWPADQYIQAAVSSLSGTGGEGGGVLLRCTDVNNFYWACINADFNIDIRRVVGGLGASVATKAAGAWSDGDILKAQMVGNTIKVFRNGTQVGTDYVDGSPLTSGSAGIAYGSGASNIIDNLEGGGFEVVTKLNLSRFPKFKLRR